MLHSNTILFLEKLTTALAQKQFIKCTLGNKRNKIDELKNVGIQIILLKDKPVLSFVYHYPTKDITKNFSDTEGIENIKELLQTHFFNADLYTTSFNFYLLIHKKETAKLIEKEATMQANSLQHDKQKNRIIKADNNVYLHQLGVTTAQGIVKKDKQDKFKQINKYIEIIEGIIKNISFPNGITVADMGCGKGYLSFALFDYLTNYLKLPTNLLGIEQRPDMVKLCNSLAQQANFKNLTFIEGSIQQTPLPKLDMLIALHACDTATDDAIFAGIKAKAKIIICAPCCHKQIRKQMKPVNALASITQHGILLERQAETITDTLRALIMEVHGYQTKIFDFIATEHTPKNVMLVGIINEKPNPNTQILSAKIAELKALFGIEQHYLEGLF